MEVQTTVFSIIIITLVVSVLILAISAALKKYDPLSEPKGLVLIMFILVDYVENQLRGETNEKITKQLGPYIASILIYIFLANISGLFAIETPTSNLSVTLVLAGITVILIEKYSMEFNGVKNYFKGYLEPFAPFVVVNILSKFSTLLSLSLRLFGNILAGGILMTIIYALTAQVSGLIPVIGKFNFFGVAIAPVLHFYFDLFSGVMQTYIFTTLTIAFIGKELPKE